MKIMITQECVGCGQCAAYCPNDAITVFGSAVINDRCVQCGKCTRFCPTGAITREK